MSYPFPPQKGDLSPWGVIVTTTPLGPNASVVSTATHGGLRLAEAAYLRLPLALRTTAYSESGWFEEDCDWALAYLALDLQAFEASRAQAAELQAAAIAIVRRFHPGLVKLCGVARAQSHD